MKEKEEVSLKERSHQPCLAAKWSLMIQSDVGALLEGKMIRKVHIYNV